MYRQPDPFASFRGQIVRAGVPFTISVLVLSVIGFLADFFSHGNVGLLLCCALSGHTVEPIWGPLTYPLVTPGFINFVFACLWMYWIGGSLERSWSTQRFALVCLSIVLLTAACVFVGTALRHTDYVLLGLWIPLSALTVAWATINPRQSLLFYFVLPVPAWALAAFQVGFIYFVYFSRDHLLGLFGLIPCAVAFWYVRSGASIGRSFTAPRGPDLRIVGRRPSPLDGSQSSGGIMGWYRAWQEQRRLRKLWRDSGFSDRDR